MVVWGCVCSDGLGFSEKSSAAANKTHPHVEGWDIPDMELNKPTISRLIADSLPGGRPNLQVR